MMSVQTQAAPSQTDMDFFSSPKERLRSSSSGGSGVVGVVPKSSSSTTNPTNATVQVRNVTRNVSVPVPKHSPKVKPKADFEASSPASFNPGPSSSSRSSSLSSSPLSSSPLSSSPLSSPKPVACLLPTSLKPKKKTALVKRKSPHGHESDSDGEYVPTSTTRPKKKKRVDRDKDTSKSKSTSKSNSRASSSSCSNPSPLEPIYRSSSRSRSTSTFPSTLPPTPTTAGTTATRICCRSTENGDPGPGHLSSELVVKGLMKSYMKYFSNPSDPSDTSFDPHETDYPVVELEYPGHGASERFILLAPKDKDHYNPIMDLEKTLYTIVEHYLTPIQKSQIGTVPKDLLSEAPSPPPSPPNSKASSASSQGSLSSLTCIDEDEDAEGDTDVKVEGDDSFPQTHPPPALDLPRTKKLPASLQNQPRVNYLRAFQRAINTRDGPLLLSSLAEINKILSAFKYPLLYPDLFSKPSCPGNEMADVVGGWWWGGEEEGGDTKGGGTTTSTGIPKEVLMRILDENYQRCVGPNISKLRKYEAFSSKVYGELMPSLIHEILSLPPVSANLSRDPTKSLFIDLGSGVGNVVVQAALQTGCHAYGIELVKGPADVAREMVVQFKNRCRMWGVGCGEIEVDEGDMLESSRVGELMKEADVVLVDNKVFEESLNEALRPKFLDLKEGAIVVSLKPFVSSMNGLNARVTERNVDDISAIFDVTSRPYYPGSVSWGNSGGTYYIHRVDRVGYKEMRERFEMQMMRREGEGSRSSSTTQNSRSSRSGSRSQQMSSLSKKSASANVSVRGTRNPRRKSDKYVPSRNLDESDWYGQ